MSQDFPQNETRKEPAPGASVGHSLNPGSLVITLETTVGGDRRVFRLHKDRVVIGSVVSADVRLSGEGVAPIHAVLELGGAGGQATIYDLASDTGLFVNNQKTVTHAVKNGDRIKIGKYELQFNVEALAELLPRERTRESEGRKLFLDPNEDLSPLLLEDERFVTEIFDYRPAQNRALQVVMSWRGTILDVEHFVKEKAVTVGTGRKEHFGIPPLLSTKRFSLVTRRGTEFSLNIDAQMRGVMQRKGRLESLGDLKTQAGGAGIALGDGDFAKVSVGEVDFYLSYTAAPPRLKMGRLFERDPLFFKFFTGSLAMTAAVIGALSQMSPPQTLEAEQIPERIATILYQPEKYVEKRREYVPRAKPEPVQKVEPVVKPVQPPKPKPTPKETVKIDIKPKHVDVKKPVPKEMNMKKPPTPAKVKPVSVTKPAGSHGQSQAKEGEGARAHGKEGARGSKKAAPSTTHQERASRPSPEGGQGRGSGHSQVQDEGNVDFLKAASGKIENILGNSAAQLGKGGEKLKGFGGFTTQGSGGLALSGDGSGGGGDAASLGGLGKHGRGGGRVGTGMGAAGSGSGIIGGKTRVAIRTGGPEEAVVMGSIDADAVEAALLAHADEFRLCYEKEINAEHPDLAGRVGTTFVIGSTGRVTNAGIQSTTLKNANVERCVLTVIRRIDFPIPRGAGVVQVSYPFKYSPAGK